MTGPHTFIVSLTPGKATTASMNAISREYHGLEF